MSSIASDAKRARTDDDAGSEDDEKLSIQSATSMPVVGEKGEMLPVTVGMLFCVMNCVATVCELAGEFYVPLKVRAQWMSKVCGCTLACAKQLLPEGGILKEIQDGLTEQRGRRTRVLARVDKEAQPLTQCTVTARGVSVVVANVMWPIYVLAKPQPLIHVLTELRKDVAKRSCDAGVDVTASVDSPVETTDRELAMAIDKDTLPQGVYWSNSHGSFIVKKVAVADSTVKLPAYFRCKKGTFATNPEAEVEIQRRRAILLATQGVMVEAAHTGQQDSQD